MTTNTNKQLPNKYKQSLLIFFLIVVIGLAYFFGTQKNNLRTNTPLDVPSPTQASSSVSIPDRDALNSFVKFFYNALELQDGKLVFSYFTTPTTSEEKDGFSWLTGADLAEEQPFYRAFLRIRISYPIVNDIQKINDTTFIIAITDQLQTYSNAGEQVGWGSVQKRDVKLTVVKVGNDWLVDKFTHPSINPGTEKYSGFDQGY